MLTLYRNLSSLSNRAAKLNVAKNICWNGRCFSANSNDDVTSNENILHAAEGKSAEDLLNESSIGIDDPIDPEFPSDVSDDYWSKWDSYDQWARNQSKHSYRPKIDPRDTSILLFPGQGSQFVGMGKQLLEFPNVPEMYKIASKILGYDLLDLCLHGPKTELDKTKHCQPAILVTSLAAVERLKCDSPNAIENCITATGFSVGEIAALVFAGSLTFEQAVSMVKVRGEAMQKASESAPSGMMTVFLKPSNKIKFACHAARLYCQQRQDMDKPVCEVANYLYPECKVIAGHEQALQFIEKTYEEFGISKCTRIPVSGAFHTQLMRPAAEKLRTFLADETVELPIIPVHSNVNAYKYKHIKYMKKSLIEQVYSPVKWEQIMHVLYARSADIAFPSTYEVGPGKQLGFLLRKTNLKAFSTYHNVDV